MKKSFFPVLLLFGFTNTVGAVEFERPKRLEGAGEPVRVDSPGYASPCWADWNGDGKKDLLVGQFSQGRITVYENLGDGNLAAGVRLQADGAEAEIPGVW